MSSPLAKQNKSPIDRALIYIHKEASHGHRIEVLARRIALLISSKNLVAEKCLDVGCGDFSLSDKVSQLTRSNRWYGVDLYEKPKIHSDKWENYRQFDGKALPFDDGSFDLALLSDVLHHASPNDQTSLIKETLRVSSLVVIKDHFEYGMISRFTLKTMDFIGNYGYGVSLPEKYFTRESFAELVATCGAKIVFEDCGIQLYDHLPILRNFIKPQWQFLALVSKGG
jgi:SAM-dependent methyltransferase